MQDSFSILFPPAYAVLASSDKINMFSVTVAPQEHIWPRLIINLYVNNDKVTHIVNGKIDREITLESIQFRRALPCILQAICEADPAQGTVKISKMDMMDAYKKSTLQQSYIGAYEYKIPSTTDEK